MVAYCLLNLLFFAQKYINPNAPSVVSLKSEKKYNSWEAALFLKRIELTFFGIAKPRIFFFKKAFVDSIFDFYTDTIYH